MKSKNISSHCFTPAAHHSHQSPVANTAANSGHALSGPYVATWWLAKHTVTESKLWVCMHMLGLWHCTAIMSNRGTLCLTTLCPGLPLLSVARFWSLSTTSRPSTTRPNTTAQQHSARAGQHGQRRLVRQCALPQMPMSSPAVLPPETSKAPAVGCWSCPGTRV